MPKVPYTCEVNGKLVTGNGSLIPIYALSNCSLLPCLTVYYFSLFSQFYPNQKMFYQTNKMLQGPLLRWTTCPNWTFSAAPPGSKYQKPAKNFIRKFLKLTSHTYAYNNLTNFKYAITENGNYANLLQFACKNL